MEKKKIGFGLGIRPDLIRAALILKYLKKYEEIETVFIWSGQHYSDNLKDIFMRELDIPEIQINLCCNGENDSEICSKLITQLYSVLKDINPVATVFLGDTNTTAGSLACAQLNIPIVHIEGCMRSYDWRMPEEKYRSLIDHLSDVIYAYLNEYKEQGVSEGLNPENIVVVGNPIVDILNYFYFDRVDYFNSLASDAFFYERELKKNNYFVMTAHRRENVMEEKPLQAIIELVKKAPCKVYFPASYRTQKSISKFKIELPGNLIMVDPIGYEELLVLMVNSRGVITDSGTVVEESCILGIPCIQMRKSTERPQVYDVKSAVKFDPEKPESFSLDLIYKKIEKIAKTKWKQPFGDGLSSKRIAEDLRKRAIEDNFNRHKKECYHLNLDHSYCEDNIN